MTDDPDITPPHGTPTVDLSMQRPATVRPGMHVTPPRATDPEWWDRLNEHVDLEHLLAEDAALHRARDPWQQPGYREHRRRMRTAKILLLEEIDRDPADRLAVEYLTLVTKALDRTV